MEPGSHLSSRFKIEIEAEILCLITLGSYLHERRNRMCLTKCNNNMSLCYCTFVDNRRNSMPLAVPPRRCHCYQLTRSSEKKVVEVTATVMVMAAARKTKGHGMVVANPDAAVEMYSFSPAMEAAGRWRQQGWR